MGIVVWIVHLYYASKHNILLQTYEVKVDVDGTEHLLYYFAISPFRGCSADVNLQQHLNAST